MNLLQWNHPLEAQLQYHHGSSECTKAKACFYFIYLFFSYILALDAIFQSVCAVRREILTAFFGVTSFTQHAHHPYLPTPC